MADDEREDYDDEPGRTKRAPDRLVRPLAVAFQACGWLFVVFGLGWIALFVIYLIDPPPEPIDDLSVSLIIAVGSMGGCFLWSVGLFRGARRMSDFRGYRTALLAAALATVPAALPHAAVLTLPVGVWALVVLLRRDVRARFAEKSTSAYRGG